MKKLCELVDITINNENCVVFKVKEGATMDLIALGCFKGTEDMLRMTKGRTPEITVFNKDGSNFSYHFGEGSTTVISDNLCQQREMIRECAILDFGIICDWSYMNSNVDYEGLVRDTINVKSMEDAQRTVTLVSGGGMNGHIRVNEQMMAHDVHVKDVAKWFKERGYTAEFDRPIEKTGLPCGKVHGFCEPVSVAEKDFDINDISKERFSVLLGNALSVLSSEYDNDKLFYSMLYDDIGMSDDEIRVIGLGDYIPKAVDEMLVKANAKAGEMKSKDMSVSFYQEIEKE